MTDIVPTPLPRSGRLLEVIEGRMAAPRPGTFALSVETWAALPQDLAGLQAMQGYVSDGVRCPVALDDGLLSFARDELAKIEDTTRVRVVQPAWEGPWWLRSYRDDAELGGDRAVHPDACDVVGMTIDISWLTHDQQVVLIGLWYQSSYYQHIPHLLDLNGEFPEMYTPAQELLLRGLLCFCPRHTSVSPFDFDVERTTGWSVQAAQRETDGYARALRALSGPLGLGEPFVARSNVAKGSLHCDFRAPEGFLTARLFEVWAMVAAPAIKALGCPTRSPEAGDPYYSFLDVSLFRRYADAGGVLWRPVNSAKRPGRGEARQPKALVPGLNRPEDLLAPPRQAWNWTGRTLSRERLEEALDQLLAEPDNPETARLGRLATDLGELSHGRLPGFRARATRSADGSPRSGSTLVAPIALERHATWTGAEEALVLGLDGLAVDEPKALVVGEALAAWLPHEVATRVARRLGTPLTPAMVGALPVTSVWDRWCDVLGEAQAQVLVQTLTRHGRPDSGHVSPLWARPLARSVRVGGHVPSRAVASAPVREVLLQDGRLLTAWFCADSKGRSDTEQAWQRAASRSALSREEATALALHKPGSKSAEDRRGLELASYFADRAAGSYGPGAATVDWSDPPGERIDFPPGPLGAPDSQEAARMRRTRRVHEVPQSAYLDPGRVGAAVYLHLEVLRQQPVNLVREATCGWLLTRGLAPDSVARVLTLAGVAEPGEAARVARLVTGAAAAGQPILGIEWIGAVAPDVGRELAATLDVVLEDGRVRAQAELDARLEVEREREQAQQQQRRAGVVAIVDGMDSTAPGRQWLRRTANFLRDVRPFLARNLLPGTVGLLASLGLPGPVMAETCRQAGFVEFQAAGSGSRVSGAAVRNAHAAAFRAARAEIGPFAASDIVGMVIQDLTRNMTGPLPVTEEVRAVAVQAIQAPTRRYTSAERKLLSWDGQKVVTPDALGLVRADTRQEHWAQVVASVERQARRGVKALDDVSDCGTYVNSRTCPALHGEVSSTPLRRGGTLACRYCRERANEDSLRSIERAWAQHNDVCMLEIVLPLESAADVQDLAARVAREEPAALREYATLAARIKRSRFAEVVPGVVTATDDKVTVEPVRVQAQPKLSDLLLRSEPLGELDTPAMLGLHQVPIRWVYGVDRILMLAPVSFVDADGRTRETGNFIESFAGWHRARKVRPRSLVSATQAEEAAIATARQRHGPGSACRGHEHKQYLHVVPRAQALRSVAAVLGQTGELIDALVWRRAKMIGIGDWVISQKRTTANQRGKAALPWPDESDLRNVRADEARGRLTPEQQQVPRGCCNRLLPLPPGALPNTPRRPCGATLTVSLMHGRSVLLSNDAGIDYSFEQAEAARTAHGVARHSADDG